MLAVDPPPPCPALAIVVGLVFVGELGGVVALPAAAAAWVPAELGFVLAGAPPGAEELLQPIMSEAQAIATPKHEQFMGSPLRDAYCADKGQPAPQCVMPGLEPQFEKFGPHGPSQSPAECQSERLGGIQPRAPDNWSAHKVWTLWLRASFACAATKVARRRLARLHARFPSALHNVGPSGAETFRRMMALCQGLTTIKASRERDRSMPDSCDENRARGIRLPANATRSATGRSRSLRALG